MLQDRKHAAVEQPLTSRSPHRRHALRIMPVGPAPDHLMGARCGNIENRQAIDIDAEALQIESVKPGQEIGRTNTGSRVLRVKFAEDRIGRVVRRERRAKALDAATLLIDQHGGIG